MNIAVVAEEPRFRDQLRALLEGQGHRIQLVPALGSAL